MFKLFKKFTLIEWLLVLFSIGFIVIQVWLDLTIPDFMTEITKAISSPTGTLKDVLRSGGWMLLCAFGSLLSSVIVSIFAARLSSNFAANVRSSLFRKVESFSMEEISNFSTATLITRSTNDVTQVQSFIVMGLQVIIKAPIMAAWAITKISNKSWQWTLSTGVAVIALLIVVLVCMLIAIPKFKKIQRLTDDVNRVTRENLNGIRVVRAYNAEKYQEEKFEKANNELTNTQLYAGRVMSFLMPGISLIMNGLALSVYWIGAYIINQADLMKKGELFADMIVFSSYAMQVVMSFMMLVIIFIMLPRASVAAKRINEVLDKKLSIKDGRITKSDSENKGEIEFDHVYFKYPDAEEYVLHDVTFKVNRGETVAFIGSTGSGKSTVINLIPRFYDVTKGSIKVDGIDIRDYTQTALRNKIGYVSQKAVLFTGTIKSNVAFGDNGKEAFLDSDIVGAVYTAQASDFVEKLEGGYDGFVAQGGTNLSGGQKQRISIARAIARQPEIFIFDDSFSALDYKTDKKLREALKKECANATKLIVAQRIGTIRDADRIIVLDEGRVVGNGTHAELMKSCEVYRQIAFSQLSEEELL